MKPIHVLMEMMEKFSLMTLELMMKTLIASKKNSTFYISVFPKTVLKFLIQPKTQRNISLS